MSEAVASPGHRTLRMVLSLLWVLMVVLFAAHAGGQTRPTDFGKVTQVVKPPRTMPQLRGRMYEDAVGELRRNFDVAVEPKFGPGPADVREGAVYDQDPAAGAPVKSPVTLSVSTGPAADVPETPPPPIDVTRVPPPPVAPPPTGPETPPTRPVDPPPRPVATMSDLIGKTLAQARADAVIRQHRIRLLVSEQSANSYFEAGRIYEQSPRPGERLNKVALVHVSTGPARMPRLIDRTFGEAQKTLHPLGARGTRHLGDSNLPEGVIYDQWPREGEPLVQTPKLYVSSGVPPPPPTTPKPQPTPPAPTPHPAPSEGDVVGTDRTQPPQLPEPPQPSQPPRLVPDVIGKTTQEAIDLIQGEHAKTKVGESELSRIPRGRIARSDPMPGEVLPPQTPVFIFPSTGTNKVPQLRRGSVDDATPEIEREGFRVANVRELNSERPKGEVLSYDPPAGAEVPVGTGLDLVVSAGPIVMPDVTGIPLGRARGKLDESQLAPMISIRRRMSWTWPNHVVEQVPRPGAELPTNRPSVTLWVSFSLAWVLAASGFATLGTAATAKALWPRLKVSLDLSTAVADWTADPDVTPEIQIKTSLEPGDPPGDWSVPIIEETRHG